MLSISEGSCCRPKTGVFSERRSHTTHWMQPQQIISLCTTRPWNGVQRPCTLWCKCGKAENATTTPSGNMEGSSAVSVVTQTCFFHPCQANQDISSSEITGHVAEARILPKFCQEAHTSSFQILATQKNRNWILWGIIWSPGFLWLHYILTIAQEQMLLVGTRHIYCTEAFSLRQFDSSMKVVGKLVLLVCGRGRKVCTMASTNSQWLSTALSGSCCLGVWGSGTELIVFLFEDCGWLCRL